ncbi:hypothetical protein [Mucilaginibacter gynuensis]|uniref:hypothetical protein n=1 Tax=Mucilaginibacter gynuensis TaxID=1302236 RepID=UPI0031EB6405
MKKIIHLLITVSVLHLLLLSIGCKKDKTQKDPDKDTKGLYSFSNTEYTGLANIGNHYYPVRCLYVSGQRIALPRGRI